MSKPCRYLLGETLTEADVRLFPTLFRHDHVYFVRFKLNKALLADSYPNTLVSRTTVRFRIASFQLKTETPTLISHLHRTCTYPKP